MSTSCYKTETLHQWLCDLLGHYFTADESRTLADILIFAELAGRKTHGLVRLVGPYSNVLTTLPTDKLEIEQVTPMSCRLDGKLYPGMYITDLLTKAAIKRAHACGMGLAAAYNTRSTSGCLGYYLYQIAEAGLIGAVFSRSLKTIAPYGAKAPLVGTNPVAVCIPAKTTPILFDAGMSVIPFGDVLRHFHEDRELPERVALNADGEPTTLARDAIKGALLPFDTSAPSGGIIGSSLSLLVEILGGLWAGGGFADVDDARGCGNTVIALQPELLMPAETFFARVDALAKSLRNTPTQSGEPLRLPGERLLTTYRQNKASGQVVISTAVIDAINTWLEKQGVGCPAPQPLAVQRA